MLPSVLPRWRRILLVAPCLSLVVSVLPHDALASSEVLADEWIPPVSGAVVRPFVAPIAVYAAGHRGVDFAAAPSTHVRAANDGTVSFAGDVAGSLHVVVAHTGGIRTSYSFLASADVQTGDPVRRGEVIGRAGGSAEGHEPGVLHFGVRVGDRYVDPMLLFRPRDLTQIVRLVPVGEREAAEHPDPRDERRELQAWIESQFDGCAVCGASEWVADHAATALNAGVELLEAAGEQGRAWAPVVAEALTATLDAVLAARAAARAALLSTPVGLAMRDVIAGGAAFLGWFGRDCDAHAPPANGEGGSGNAVLAVGGIDSHRERGDDRSFDLAAGKLGYDRSERFWFSYRRGSALYRKPDTYGNLRKKARMLGEQLQQAAREQPHRSFDLIGHSQGGVVIALFLATVYPGHESEYPPIENVLTFAAPLKGTPLASRGEAIARNPAGEALMEGIGAAGLPIPDPLATSIRQLAEGSEVIRDIEKAGIPEAISFTSIAGVEDWQVPVRSTELRGADPQAVDVAGFADSHQAIVRDPRALMSARAALEHRRLPCTSFGENVKASLGSTLLSGLERGGAVGLGVGL
jgi:Peptidase family M23